MRILVSVVAGLVAGLFCLEVGIPPFGVGVATLLGIGVAVAVTRQYAEHD